MEWIRLLPSRFWRWLDEPAVSEPDTYRTGETDDRGTFRPGDDLGDRSLGGGLTGGGDSSGGQ